MKKSFYTILSETFKKPNKWNYYNPLFNFGKELPFISEQSSIDFLKNFIKVAGKAEQKLFIEIDSLGNRATHTVSTFFLGHFIYQNTILKDLIDEEIIKLRKDFSITDNVEFSFLWFLTCLFHDLGYNIENNSSINYSDFDDLKQKTSKLSDIYGVPFLYEDIHIKYFNFRIKYHKKNDHGIVAAYLLNFELNEIRELASSNPNLEQEKLSWSKDSVQLYNFCSWNILAHNIWYINVKNECDKKKYDDAGLNALILNKEGENIQYKINSKENPFLFLFCLVDTLEPYKKLMNINHLKNISLEISENKSEIIISTKLNCGCHNLILNQAESLNDWLAKCDVIEKGIKINLV